MESDLAMVDHGEIEVIGVDPNMGVRYDGHCSIGMATGAHAVYTLWNEGMDFSRFQSATWESWWR